MENNLFLNINSNEKLVLKEIFNHQNISRTEISKNLGINKATISSILNKLKSKSLVREVGEGDSTKSRSEEHTSELQSRFDIVCRLLLEKKNKDNQLMLYS